jgi:hypothetical protein
VTFLVEPKKSRTVLGCEEILEEIIREGFMNQINWFSLRIIIKRVKGGDPRTLKNWRNNLLDLGYIECTHSELFKVNLTRYSGALEKVVKSVGQKKLM